MSLVNKFPVPAFLFTIDIGEEVACREVSGIGVEQNVKDVVHGGLSSHSNKVKDRTKFMEFTIKRGMFAGEPDKWKKLRENFFNARYKDAIQLFEALRVKELSITLKTEKEAFITWSFTDACPTKWIIEPFNSMENKVSGEAVTFTCRNMSIEHLM